MAGAHSAATEEFAAFLLRMRGVGITDKRLLSAFETVPRAAFIPRQFQSAAYSNRMIPIEYGETIESLDLQARILAEMEIDPGHRILEVGTGSGYTAAVLSRLAARVTTLDRYKGLVSAAQTRHKELGLENISAHQADGRQGYRIDGPYDRIVFWAAFDGLPRNSVDWLATNGIMLVPIGPEEGEQTFAKLTKIGSRFEREDICPVRLQPLFKDLAAKL